MLFAALLAPVNNATAPSLLRSSPSQGAVTPASLWCLWKCVCGFLLGVLYFSL